MSDPCSMAAYCKNSPENKGEALTQCALCRLSPENTGRDMVHFWYPTPEARTDGLDKHPDLVWEKRKEKSKKTTAKLQARRSRDPKRRVISRLASKAEKTTERNIIHATKNSGRSNKDGDHVSAGNITLDTKLQTTRENPVVLLHELEKVNQDAARAGNAMGALVLRNKFGVGVVVMKERDYAILVEGLKDDNVHGGPKAEVGPTIPEPGERSSDLV